MKRRDYNPILDFPTEEVLARGNPWTRDTVPIVPVATAASAVPTAPRRTAGERVSWLDRLNWPSTSNPYGCDPPPHQQPTTPRWAVDGDPGGFPRSSSSSSTSATRYPRAPRVPQVPRSRRPLAARDGRTTPRAMNIMSLSIYGSQVSNL